VGSWEDQVTVTVPERKQGRWSATTAWILGDRFLQTKSQSDLDNSEAVSLYTYDLNRRVLRAWWFSSLGFSTSFTGSWDEASSTFTFKVDDAGQGSSTVTSRFINDDHREWKVITKDADGKVVYEMSGKSTRQKKPGKPSGETKRAAVPTLTIFCTATLRRPVDDFAARLSRQEGAEFARVYNGSGVLLAQLKVGMPADLLLLESAKHREMAEKEGLITSAQTICHLTPVILVPRGNPRQIRSLNDLTRPGLRWGLGDAETSMLGQVTKEILGNNKIADEQVRQVTVLYGHTASNLTNSLRVGSIDAAIVWDVTGAECADFAASIAIPSERNVVLPVWVAVLKSSAKPDLARKVVEALVSEQGKEVFAKHHFAVRARQAPEKRD
jgi:molybdate transport system substrate-binding protein